MSLSRCKAWLFAVMYTGIVVLPACTFNSQIPDYDPVADQAFVGADDSADAMADPEYVDTAGQRITRFAVDGTDAGALRFSKDDALKVSIWGYEELDHVAIVQPNGRVTLPLVGDVFAEDRTAEEIRREVLARLSEFGESSQPHLRVGDIVKLFVWQHEDLSYVATVQPDGTVTFPLVGTMEVVGRELPEVQAEARERLREYIRQPNVWLVPEVSSRKILLEPRVSVLPWKIKMRTVSVLGEVYNPGLQTLEGSKRVIDVLSVSQMKDTANWNHVVVIRNYDGEQPSYRRLRMRDFLRGEAPEQNIYLEPDDIIMVPRTAIGQVGMYIDHFFSKTRPVFDWWLAGQAAVYYSEDRAAINRYRDLTIEGLQRQIFQAEQYQGAPQ